MVEGSTIIRMGAVDLVRSAGYAALEAKDADDAIRILEARDDIDLVFPRAQMPRAMDCSKLSYSIRYRWPPVRIIFTSAMAIIERVAFPRGAGSSRNPAT